MIEISIRVSLMRQIMKILQHTTNRRSVEPSYRYFGVRCTDKVVTFSSCGGDMLGRWDCPVSADVRVISAGDPSDALMLDSFLFGELFKSFEDEQWLTLVGEKTGKGTTVHCANHSAHLHFNFDVSISDHKPESFYGGPIPETGDMGAWRRFDIGLSDFAKRVDYCASAGVFGDEPFKLCGVRLSIKDCNSPQEGPVGGSLVQVQATDRNINAHVRCPVSRRIPEVELMIESNTIELIHHLKPSGFYYNGQSLAFKSDDGHLKIYCRNEMTIDKFPKGIVERIRATKNFVVLRVERNALENVLFRQVLFANRTEGITYSTMTVNQTKGEIEFAANNRITKGNDSVGFATQCGSAPMGAFVINPEGMLTTVKRHDERLMDIVLIPLNNNTEMRFLGLKPVSESMAAQAANIHAASCIAGDAPGEEEIALTAAKADPIPKEQ